MIIFGTFHFEFDHRASARADNLATHYRLEATTSTLCARLFNHFRIYSRKRIDVATSRRRLFLTPFNETAMEVFALAPRHLRFLRGHAPFMRPGTLSVGRL